MNSKIQFGYIETEAKGLQPAIHVSLKESDDTRDKLAKSFFNQLKHTSSWLVVKFDDYVDPQNGNKINITIQPVSPDEIEETIQIMKNRIYPVKEPRE